MSASDTLVLRQDRYKIALTIMMSVAFVAIGVWMASGSVSSSRYSPELLRGIGVFSVVFFGWAGLVSVRALLDPAELILSAQGFEVRGWRARPLIPWSDVEEFSLTGTSVVRLVACTLTSEAEDRVRRDRRGLFGVTKTDFVPQRLKQNADYVCRILNDWRRAYG
jgi:hypothetical protein